MAFLGEAIGHGMLPGVAIATLIGVPPILGAAVSAAAMSGAIGMLQRRGRLSYDTSIGLLFVGMLSLGVIIVSHSGSFATDATVMLFGDVLAVTWGDLATLSGALLATLALAALLHRAFVAAAFDDRIATTLGLRPRLAHIALTGLVTLAVVASYQAVGTLLVVGMLIAPAVAAGRWTRSIVSTMILAAVLGMIAVVSGLLVSWHAAPRSRSQPYPRPPPARSSATRARAHAPNASPAFCCANTLSNPVLPSPKAFHDPSPTHRRRRGPRPADRLRRRGARRTALRRPPPRCLGGARGPWRARRRRGDRRAPDRAPHSLRRR
jgi:zinc/manganese transport system permease protein/manganese/iron transport system permease protein